MRLDELIVNIGSMTGDTRFFESDGDFLVFWMVLLYKTMIYNEYFISK